MKFIFKAKYLMNSNNNSKLLILIQKTSLIIAILYVLYYI